MRASVADDPLPLESHDALAFAFAEASSVAPDVNAHPELFDPLVFGPMLPPRYRLNGPGAMPDAAELLLTQIATSPRAPVEPDDVASLGRLGLSPVGAYR